MSEPLPITYVQFRSLVDMAIAINKQQREVNAGFFRAVSPHYAAAEFCTVALDVGRGVGKSRYIVERAQPHDIVLIAKATMERVSFKGCSARVLCAADRPRFSYQLAGAPRPVDFTIWVDEPGMCTNLAEALGLILAWSIPVIPTIVMLGRPPRS